MFPYLWTCRRGQGSGPGGCGHEDSPALSHRTGEHHRSARIAPRPGSAATRILYSSQLIMVMGVTAQITRLSPLTVQGMSSYNNEHVTHIIIFVIFQLHAYNQSLKYITLWGLNSGPSHQLYWTNGKNSMLL